MSSRVSPGSGVGRLEKAWGGGGVSRGGFPSVGDSGSGNGFFLGSERYSGYCLIGFDLPVGMYRIPNRSRNFVIGHYFWKEKKRTVN